MIRYHLLLLLNGDKIRNYRTSEKADHFWGVTLERTLGVPVPNHGLIEVASSESGNHGVLIPSTDEALARAMIKHSSYLAKLNTKGDTGKGIREFGCSIL